MHAEAQPTAVDGVTAQTQCDPVYGCETTTTESTAAAQCDLNTTQVTAGDTVIATVTNVPVGDRIDITFNGVVIASATATADGQGTAAGAAPLAPAGHLAVAQTVSGGAQITFRVPPETATGSYEVRAIGPAFNADCTAGTDGLSVQGAAVTRNPVGGGSLSKTGITVALYLVLALALIIAGWQFVRAARARRNAVQPQSVVR